ncbi:hypothetical protein BpHYR1_031125, partial [Brachionus plicatilis]
MINNKIPIKILFYIYLNLLEPIEKILSSLQLFNLPISSSSLAQPIKNTLKHLQTHPVGKMILTPSNSLLGSSQYQYQTPNQETAQTQSMYQADTFNSGHSYYQQYYPGYYNPADSLYYPNPSSLLLPNQLYS